MDGRGTATHIVCPVCGKSSSLKSFPAGAGTDLVLQTFRSLGRGKGFTVAARESGINDRRLGAALAPKVLETLSVLAAHGHISVDEILAAVDNASSPTRAEEGPELGTMSTRFETELALEKKTRAFLEHEITDLQTSTSRVLSHWREEERRTAMLQRRIKRFEELSDRLVMATREGVESLQALRDELKGASRGSKELADHVRRMRVVVEAVQAVRDAQNEPAVRRGGPHDAR